MLSLLLLQTCATNRVQKMSDYGKNLEHWEIQWLSEDCNYVRKKIAKGLQKIEDENNSRTTFSRNDFLFSLISNTPCFQEKTEDQIIKLLGKSLRHCDSEDCSTFSLKYYFLITENEYNELTFYFKDKQLLVRGLALWTEDETQ